MSPSGGPPPSRFVWKVIVIGVAAVILATIVAGVSARGDLERHWRARVEEQLSEEARVVANVVELALAANDGDGSTAGLQRAVDRVALELPGRRITLIDSDGWVIVDSHESARLMDNHAMRPEVTSLGAVLERYSRTVRKSMLYCVIAVPTGPSPVDGAMPGNDDVLYVRLAHGAEHLAESLGAYTNSAHGGLWLGAAVGLLVVLLGSFWVTGRLRQLSDAVARTDGRPIGVEGSDELGFIATTLNARTSADRSRIGRLEDALDRDRAIFGSMEEGVVILDRDGRIRLVNAAARRLLCTGEGDLKQRLLVEATACHEVVVAVSEALDNDERTLREVRVQSDGGAESVIHLSAVPLGEPGSRSWGCVVVLHDLTEIRRLEAMRRDFVANVSHELKTPLTAMKGYLEAILDDDDMPAEIRHRFLTKARNNTDRLAAIVSDLLALARIQGGDTVDFEMLDVRNVVETCARDLRNTAEVRDIAITTHVVGEGFEMQGDESALMTAVRNLIDNAIKYSHDSSEVRATVTRSGDDILIDVSDEGQGIPMHEQERIFERFYRVDKNRSRELGGTGLGLSIVKNAVQAHRGEVSVTSRHGRGSTFTIRLPVI